MKSNDNKKICFIASSGGHFEQLLMLKPLMIKYNSFVVTEKTNYTVGIKNIRTYFLRQVNRKEKLFIFNMLFNTAKSIGIILKEKPDYIISTGVLATIPMCFLGKLLKKKIIYIESFAKVTTPTQTGKLMYKYADQFYVQWPQMLKVYPNAIYLGGIY